MKPIESAMNLAYNRCQGKRLEKIDVSSTPSLPEPVAGTERVFHFSPLQSRNENAEPQLPWIRGQGFDLRKLHDKAYFCFGQKNRDEPMTSA